jgi:hypothetical protein
MKENIKTEKDYTDWMVKTGGYAKDMTLRDYFAGRALEGFIRQEELTPTYEQIAEANYQMADAMLKERSK